MQFVNAAHRPMELRCEKWSVCQGLCSTSHGAGWSRGNTASRTATTGGNREIMFKRLPMFQLFLGEWRCHRTRIPSARLSNPLPSSVPSMDLAFRAHRSVKPVRPETMLRQKNDYGKL